MYTFGKTIQGIEHKAFEIENQDYLDFDCVGPFVLGVVADGCGARRLASQGSSLCGKAAMSILRNGLPLDEALFEKHASSVLKTAFCAALIDYFRTVSPGEVEVADLESTLMAFAFNANTGSLFYSYVGDGGLIFESEEDGAWRLAEPPQKGADFHITSTIIKPEAWRFGHIKNASALMCATDGLFDCLRSGEALDDKALLMLPNCVEGSHEADETMDRLVDYTRDDRLDEPFGACTDDRSIIFVRAQKRFAPKHMKPGAETGEEGEAGSADAGKPDSFAKAVKHVFSCTKRIVFN